MPAISEAACLLVLVALLIFWVINHKMQHEKLYYLRVFPYYIFAGVFVGWIPLGIFFTLLVLTTHTNIKNRKYKLIAAILGFAAVVASIIINKAFNISPSFFAFW